MKIYLFIFSFSLFILGSGCTSSSENNSSAIKNDKTNQVSIPAKDSVLKDLENEITYNTDTAFIHWKNKIEEIIFEPQLFEDKIKAIAWFEEKGYAVSDSYSEEETKSGLWVVLESSDAKYHIEFLYDYYDTEGHFQGFRHIISKIVEEDRYEMIKLFKDLSENDTKINPVKYKKSYGEEGLLWQDEKKNPQMQTIVVTKGGNANWIEIQRCFYPRVSPDEIIK